MVEGWLQKASYVDAYAADTFISTALRSVHSDNTNMLWTDALAAILDFASWQTTYVYKLVNRETMEIVRTSLNGLVSATAGTYAGDCFAIVTNSIYAEVQANINPLRLHLLARADLEDAGAELVNWSIKPVGAAEYTVSTPCYYQRRDRNTGERFPLNTAPDGDFYPNRQACIDAILAFDANGLDVGGWVFDEATQQEIYINPGAYEVSPREIAFKEGAPL